MTPHDPMLPSLCALQPDRQNVQRVRARCVARLQRSNRRSQRWKTITRVTRDSAGPLLAAGLCVLYAAELLETAARVLTGWNPT